VTPQQDLSGLMNVDLLEAMSYEWFTALANATTDPRPTTGNPVNKPNNPRKRRPSPAPIKSNEPQPVF
jgi:hypothetical protein